MKQLRKGLLLQVLLIMTLIMLTYQKENTAPSKEKQKKSGGNRCRDCIKVRVNMPKNPTMATYGTGNINERAIVKFDYRSIPIPGGIPDNIMEVNCLGMCRGHEMDMNVVHIKRSIPYLKKEKNIYVLKEMTVTVGCTCVYPNIIEQHMT